MDKTSVETQIASQVYSASLAIRNNTIYLGRILFHRLRQNIQSHGLWCGRMVIQNEVRDRFMATAYLESPAIAHLLPLMDEEPLALHVRSLRGESRRYPGTVERLTYDTNKRQFRLYLNLFECYDLWDHVDRWTQATSQENA